MARLISTIRPVSGADGPFYVVTKRNGDDFNVSTGVTGLVQAVNQAVADQGSVFVLPFVSAVLDTVDSG